MSKNSGDDFDPQEFDHVVVHYLKDPKKSLIPVLDNVTNFSKFVEAFEAEQKPKCVLFNYSQTRNDVSGATEATYTVVPVKKPLAAEPAEDDVFALYRGQLSWQYGMMTESAIAEMGDLLYPNAIKNSLDL